MSRLRIVSTSLLLAIAVLVTLTGPAAGDDDTPAPRPHAAVAESPVRRAHLRVVVLTTSERVQVTLPGVSAGHHVIGASRGRDVVPGRHGLTVRGPADTFGLVGIDTITEVAADATTVRLDVRQGDAGATLAWVENVATGRAGRMRVWVDASAPTTLKVPVTDLFGAPDVVLARAVADPVDRQVLAFAYPWFSEAAVDDPRLSVHPTTPLLANRFAGAVQAAELARSNGIDGFVMSFAGGARDGLHLHQALEAAHATGGTATALIEGVQAGDPAVVEQWVREALRQADHPAFLRFDGHPVVFVFGAFTLESGVLSELADTLAAEGTPVRFVTDAHVSRRSGIAGGYRYEVLQRFQPEALANGLVRLNLDSELFARAGATLRGQEPTLHVATVQPGFDDRPLRGDARPVVDRDGTSTYDATWAAAVATQPDWVVITSWNEWYEGTSIAPSIEHSHTALAATPGWADLLRTLG